MEELFYNLVSNAIKYNKPNGKVDIILSADNDNLQVAVSDNGIGIPDRDKPRVFERFYRVDKSRSKKLGGTGLGLAIVKHIAENYDAELRLESKEGEGTKISVRFP
jgi:two-component system phosphate regulon sensor histidine kinase PhoR